MTENIHIESAPLAGYTDRAFRKILMECGAKTVYTEMVSVAALCHKNEKTIKMLELDKEPGITNVVQIFGNKPENFAKAVAAGYLNEFDEININMGCPAKKIVSNGEGAALMLNMDLARDIIKACLDNTDKPITVKMRLGYNPIDRDINQGRPEAVLELAKICQELGVKKIIVHGRVAAQGFSGKADWYAIKQVVDSVNIPVIANGDVSDEDTAKECLEITGADGLMIGRATIGAPWSISLSEKPSEDEIVKILKRHLELAKEHGVRVPTLRKQLVEYFDHFKGGKEIKDMVVKIESYDEVLELIEKTLNYTM